MANYPQELAQDAVCHSHTGHMTGLWFLPSRLNTNKRMTLHHLISGSWYYKGTYCLVLEDFWTTYPVIHFHILDVWIPQPHHCENLETLYVRGLQYLSLNVISSYCIVLGTTYCDSERWLDIMFLAKNGYILVVLNISQTMDNFIWIYHYHRHLLNQPGISALHSEFCNSVWCFVLCPWQVTEQWHACIYSRVLIIKVLFIPQLMH